jgi:lipopolysaccharide biosynthesis glycosyltransferase
MVQLPLHPAPKAVTVVPPLEDEFQPILQQALVDSSYSSGLCKDEEKKVAHASETNKNEEDVRKRVGSFSPSQKSHSEMGQGWWPEDAERAASESFTFVERSVWDRANTDTKIFDRDALWQIIQEVPSSSVKSKPSLDEEFNKSMEPEREDNHGENQEWMEQQEESYEEDHEEDHEWMEHQQEDAWKQQGNQWHDLEGDAAMHEAEAVFEEHNLSRPDDAILRNPDQEEVEVAAEKSEDEQQEYLRVVEDPGKSGEPSIESSAAGSSGAHAGYGRCEVKSFMLPATGSTEAVTAREEASALRSSNSAGVWSPLLPATGSMKADTAYDARDVDVCMEDTSGWNNWEYWGGSSWDSHWRADPRNRGCWSWSQSSQRHFCSRFHVPFRNCNETQQGASCEAAPPQPGAEQKAEEEEDKEEEAEDEEVEIEQGGNISHGEYISRLLHTENSDKGNAGGKYAFVAVVFGSDPAYCLEAAVLGTSLKKHTQHHMVLLHTDDVPEDWLDVCEKVGWRKHCIEHIPCHKSVYPEGRFAGVFTKLQVLGIEGYEKVVLIDTDTLVRKNLDLVFLKDVPAAVRRHASGNYEDGEDIAAKHLFKGDNQVGGINAGFVLLKPSAKDLKRMQFQLLHGQVPGKLPFQHGPEQDYFTRFYAADVIKNLGIEYNYQLHQLSYCSRHVGCRRMTLPYEDVKVLHFSGPTSLTKWALDAEHHSQRFETFAKKVILRSYFVIMDKERQRSTQASRDLVKEHLRKVSTAAMKEWYDTYADLLVKVPSINRLLENARGRAAPHKRGDRASRKNKS